MAKLGGLLLAGLLVSSEALAGSLKAPAGWDLSGAPITVTAWYTDGPSGPKLGSNIVLTGPFSTTTATTFASPTGQNGKTFCLRAYAETPNQGVVEPGAPALPPVRSAEAGPLCGTFPLAAPVLGTP